MSGPVKLGVMIAIVASVLLLAAIGLSWFEKINPQTTSILRAVVLVLLLFIAAIAIGIHIASDIKVRPDTEIHIPGPEEMPPHG